MDSIETTSNGGHPIVHGLHPMFSIISCFLTFTDFKGSGSLPNCIQFEHDVYLIPIDPFYGNVNLICV